MASYEGGKGNHLGRDIYKMDVLADSRMTQL